MIAPPGQRPRGTAEAEVLFAEARRRRRRRRLAGGVACLLLAGLVAAGLVTAWPRRGAVRPARRPRGARRVSRCRRPGWPGLTTAVSCTWATSRPGPSMSWQLSMPRQPIP